MTKLVYSTLQQLQPHLNGLYTGPDSLFSRMMVCATCSQSAVDPRDCHGCQKLICGPCAATQQKCGGCNTSLGERTLHPVVKEICTRATFRCIHECGELKLSFDTLTDHVVNTCPKRTMHCPNACEVMPFCADELDHHLERCAL